MTIDEILHVINFAVRYLSFQRLGTRVLDVSPRFTSPLSASSSLRVASSVDKFVATVAKLPGYIQAGGVAGEKRTISPHGAAPRTFSVATRGVTRFPNQLCFFELQPFILPRREINERLPVSQTMAVASSFPSSQLTFRASRNFHSANKLPRGKYERSLQAGQTFQSETNETQVSRSD